MQTLEAINLLGLHAFVDLFGGIYEHSPWVAEQAWAARPFASFGALQAALAAAVAGATREAKLGLIRAHPELLGRLAPADLTAESRREQAGAGLNQCSPAELAQLTQLNRAYREKFGFPFVVAVSGLSRHDIIARMRQRLAGEAELEFSTCLREIDKIAGHRLAALTRA